MQDRRFALEPHFQARRTRGLEGLDSGRFRRLFIFERMTDAQDQKLSFYGFYFLIILVGGGFLWGGIYEYHHAYTLYHNGLPTQGKVQKVEDRSNTDADWTTYEVAFAATDHHTYTIQNHYSVADKVKLYKVGESVPVIYLPTAPEDGRIDNRREQSGVYGGCFLGALIALLVGTLFFYFVHWPYLLRKRAL